MSDLKVTFASNGRDLFDLALEDLDRDVTLIDVHYGVGHPTYTTTAVQPETGLLLEDSFTTAMLWSLFTDARAEPEELPEGWTDRRGWLGDEYEPDGLPWGSKLWLITDIPGKATENRRQLAERYTKEAVQWMITDGVASRIPVDAWWINGGGRLGIYIPVYDGGGQLIFESKWALTMEQGEQGTRL